MDIMLILQIIVFLGAIFFGIRLGGIGIGYAGGVGVVVLGLCLGMPPGQIPWDVILIIMSVIAAISAMQLSGGLDYLVFLAEKLLRKNPKQINYLAPAITYFLTILAGTGHTAFSLIPVIVEVAREQNIKPSVPLSISVVSSQIAITASPVGAAVITMTGLLEPLGWSYPVLLLIWIPTTFIGCMVTAFIISRIYALDLDKDPVYLERLQKGLIEPPIGAQNMQIKKGAKLSVLIFVLGIACIVIYATAISKVGGKAILIENVVVGRDAAIMSFMLSIATLITLFCKIEPAKIADTSVFKNGMVACVCVLGVAWLGNTFVGGHTDQITSLSQSFVQAYPASLAFILFFVSMLLYSQAATAKAVMPVVIAALGITTANPHDSYIVIASFAAVSGLFVLPTYPTTLGAIGMDYTGTTRGGKYIFNHSFFLPGVLSIAISVALGFVITPIFA